MNAGPSFGVWMPPVTVHVRTELPARQAVATSRTTVSAPGRSSITSTAGCPAGGPPHPFSDAQSAAVRRLRQPGYQRHELWFRCMRSLLDGKLEIETSGRGTRVLVLAPHPRRKL